MFANFVLKKPIISIVISLFILAMGFYSIAARHGRLKAEARSPR